VKKKIILITTIVLIILSTIYTYEVYKELYEFVTIDAGYIVNVIEFSLYREKQIVLSSLFYFGIVTVSMFTMSNLYKYNSNKIRIYIIIIALLVVNTLCSNKYFPVYIILALLSFFIVYGVNFVSNLLWGSTIEYKKDELIEKSDFYSEYELAEIHLNNYISQKKLPKESIIYEIYNEDSGYFFEIYAKRKLMIPTE